MRRRAALAVLVISLLAACGGDDDDDAGGPDSTTGPPGGVSVQQAIDAGSDGPVLVNGFLLAVDGNDVLLCGGAIMESAPPQCADPFLRVDGLELSSVDGLRDLGGWSEGEVRLTGIVADGVLTVSTS